MTYLIESLLTFNKYATYNYIHLCARLCLCVCVYIIFAISI